jgi:hypothetical protein
LLILIIENMFYVYTEPDESVLDAVREQISVNFEGKLDDTDDHINYADVPKISPEFDENWMDSYSEGRRIT